MARINRHFFVGKTGEGRLPSGTKKRLHIRLVPDMGPLHHVLKGTESFMPSDGETRRAVSLTPSSPNVPGRTRGGAHRGRAIRNRSAYSSCRPHTGRTTAPQYPASRPRPSWRDRAAYPATARSSGPGADRRRFAATASAPARLPGEFHRAHSRGAANAGRAYRRCSQYSYRAQRTPQPSPC